MFQRLALYDKEAEKAAREWIEEITRKKIGDDFFGSLRNGVILCHLMNKIKPGIIPVFEHEAQHFLQEKVPKSKIRPLIPLGQH